MRQTSLDAYDSIKHEIGAQEFKILCAVDQLSQCSRRQVAKLLGMETGTVSARVNSLVKHGFINEIGVKKCPITNKKVNFLEVSKCN